MAKKIIFSKEQTNNIIDMYVNQKLSTVTIAKKIRL